MGAPAVAQPSRAPAPRRRPANRPRRRVAKRPVARPAARRRPDRALTSRGSRPAPRRIQLAQPAVAGAAQAAVRTAGAVRDLSDSSAIVRLTRGRGWIALLCALLGGIVALNVISLSLTSVSGRAEQQISELERANSALRGEIAEQLSATRVEAWAAQAGLAATDPRDIGYLDPDAASLDRVLDRLEEGTLLSGADPAPTEVLEPGTAAPVDPAAATATPVVPAPSTTEPVAPAPAPVTGGSSGGVGL
jgi:hypothetical protein